MGLWGPSVINTLQQNHRILPLRATTSGLISDVDAAGTSSMARSVREGLFTCIAGDYTVSLSARSHEALTPSNEDVEPTMNWHNRSLRLHDDGVVNGNGKGPN